MRVIRSRNFQFGLLLASALSFSMLPSASEAYTPEQQQACSGDAFRLCGPEIPDVDRVTACMIARKAELSPGCRVFFRAGPEPVAETDASGRPRASTAHQSRISTKSPPRPDRDAASAALVSRWRPRRWETM